MKSVSTAGKVSANLDGKTPPTLTLEQLDADPHGVFRQYRKDHAVVLHETGGYFALRFSDVDRLSKDPRFRASGTAFPETLGISSGTIFDAFEYGMLTVDGDVPSPPSRTIFADVCSPHDRRDASEHPPHSR
jgi:hypothetical protein